MCRFSIIWRTSNLDCTSSAMPSVVWGAVAVFLVYGAISVLLFFLPTLLHKRKKLKFKRCHHISHRGGAGERPENTIAAFQHAVDDCGTNMLELDCRLTADGRVVVAHDADLLRIADVEKRISELDYDELPCVSRCVKMHFSNGHFEYADESEWSCRIPLLEEVFQLFPDVPINVDVKVCGRELAEKVNGLIQRYDREEITVWGNLSDDTCNTCYSLNPKIPLLFSLRRCMFLLVAFYLGLLPFIPLKESCLEIIMPTIITRLTSKVSFGHRLTIRLMDWLVMNRLLFYHLGRRGIHVYVWVLNEEEDFRRAYSLGVDGVMTDYPTQLRKFIDANL